MSKFTMNDLVAFLKEAREAAPDAVAVKAKDLYPEWKTGVAVAAGKRMRHGDKLYKCRQAHTTEFTPDQVPALWSVIDETHAGTLADPIPAAAGMDYVIGNYYIEGETVYLCKFGDTAAGTVVNLQYLPSALIGQYFEVV